MDVNVIQKREEKKNKTKQTNKHLITRRRKTTQNIKKHKTKLQQ